MSEEQYTFDDILDQLAQGETYAARDDIVLDDAMADLTDGGPEGSRSSRRSIGARLTPNLAVLGEAVPMRSQPAKVLILPRPAAVVRVFSLAVVVMMALMTALAAIIAQSVEDLTGEVRNDERFNLLAEVHDQPVDPAVLMNNDSFARLLKRWPERRQQLLLKRFRAFLGEEDWRPAAAAYQAALEEDALTVPAADRLRFCRALIALREIERAQLEIARIPVQELDDSQKSELAGMATRLQLASAASL